MKLLINDIQRQNHALRSEIQGAIDRVLNRGWYILGPEVAEFEREFARFCGVNECISTANGTDSLELALRAIGIGPGDRVATVANAGMYGTTAILRAGGTPVFVDVDPATKLMTAASLQTAGAVKAAIVTHLYGRFADVKSLDASGIPVIEDCAQAHGLGSFRNLACFSFYPTKNLGALGDGGAVVTNDKAIADRLRSLRQYGWTAKYRSDVPGGRNSRMDELQAAILRVKLPHLSDWNRRRREIALRYDEGFGIAAATDVAHLYVIRSTVRSRLRDELAARGIATEIHYPIPDHRQSSIRSDVRLPVTERLCEEVLTLPLFPEMTEAEVEGVIRAVLETGNVLNESLFV